MALEDITAQALLTGIIPGSVVQVVACNPIEPDAATVVLEGFEERLHERMVFRPYEPDIALAVECLEGNAGDFKRGAEAHRMYITYAFGPLMAIRWSNAEPLLHQITTVCEAMLRRPPQWFVFAEVPVAGKNIMADFLIRELFVRDERCMIVAPGKPLAGIKKRGEDLDLTFGFVDGDTEDGLYNIAAPFDREPGSEETKMNLSVPDLMGRVANTQLDQGPLTTLPEA
jgi:hypothetical protein